MEPNEGDAHDTAKRRVQARTELATHVGMYLIMNVGFVAIWALTGAHYPWFIWPMFGWGIGNFAHLLRYFFGPGSAGEERAIARELRRHDARAH